MTTATLTRLAPTRLDVLLADLAAIDTTITSLRHRIAASCGRMPMELQPYLDSAVARRVEVLGEIAVGREGVGR